MSGPEFAYDVKTTVQRPTPEHSYRWHFYWTMVHKQPWRTEPEIDEERQRFLAARRDVSPNAAREDFPFRDENGPQIKLTRADVEWLLAGHESFNGILGPIDWDDARQHQRRGIDLRGADLSEVRLDGLPLAGTYAFPRDIVRDILPFSQDAMGDIVPLSQNAMKTRAAYLANHSPGAVNLRDTYLWDVDLRGADLTGADLRGASLSRAKLQGATLASADMQGASLWEADLRGANLTDAKLQGASLIRARMDVTTNLRAAHLDSQVSLADVIWDGVPLTQLDWDQVHVLGDESHGEEEAVRANRQLATALREQGLNEAADRFAYRAQFCQRAVLRGKRKYLRYLGSWLLDLISGHGYKPLRSFATYLFFIVGFALIYYFLRDSTHPALNPLDSIIFSITSFHGRGFMPGENVTLHNPLTIFAAIEAIIGLVIEISFIATFTQRYFSTR
jgi:uncharacterized protein YjbI with pentapeptide repeats